MTVASRAVCERCEERPAIAIAEVRVPGFTGGLGAVVALCRYCVGWCDLHGEVLDYVSVMDFVPVSPDIGDADVC